MAVEAEIEEKPARKGGFMSILIALVLFLATGGGVGFAVYSQLIPLDLGSSGKAEAPVSTAVLAKDGYSYVAIPEIVVSLGNRASAQHLRASLYLETYPASEAHLTKQMPRIIAVVSAYLRAAEEADLGDPAAVIRLRSLLLHRVRLAVGRELVTDLLITEFIFN